MFKFIVLFGLLVALAYADPLPNHKNHKFSISPHIGLRIINGTDTTIEENPYQISIQLKDYGHWCGGSIISKNWVITAAHCMTKKNAHFKILAGTANQFEGGKLYSISEIISHKKFNSSSAGNHGNDIALIRITDNFEFDKTQRAITPFDKNEETTPGSMAVVTGWGETGNGYPDILNRVELPIISKVRCNEMYKDFGGIGDGQICAGYEEGGKDACQGDSGGPMAIDGRLAGIISWGHGCAVAGEPGVYTEIAYFRDWIKEHSNV